MRRNVLIPFLLTLLCLSLTGCAANPQGAAPTAAPSLAASPPPLATTVILGDQRPSELPAVAAQRERIAAALAMPPFVLLRDDLEPRLGAAQTAAVNDARVRTAILSPTGQPLRSEVMTVADARAGDVPAEAAATCPPGRCLRVVLYVYPTNSTLTALVDDRSQVVSVQILADAQPEIPQDLAELATQIAIADPQLASAFEGLTPTEAMATMQATKTALETTSCERSRHLCVAPVFTWGSLALWTIVDLTDFTLVAATTWTEQGASQRRIVVSEATLQDAALAPLCETPQRLDYADWQAAYLLTSSDGLELRDVTFQGRPVVTSVKVVDWHIGYQGVDGQRVGFSDAVGCPVFSAAAVIPYSLPELTEEPDGSLRLAMTFRSPNWPLPCNYQYSFTATFAPDGTLSVLVGNEGRGCGTEGIYHPVVRIEPPVTPELALVEEAGRTLLQQEGFAVWEAGNTQRFALATEAGALAVAPIWGDAELAYLYWTQARPEEGQGDLPSIGTCCGLDERQGPEQFIGPGTPEPLGTAPILWFVPRIANAERERCWADTTIIDGATVPEIWPCSAGVEVRFTE
ncbi:hypothetical protein [Candidatus Chloroploca sp. Khr17]|uniref:hypothetical protein n=1 Tax=Candidatus Chloroploca sp. Khr17 TaxID=2496869 RepID=UPI00101CA183|nr:hypothetical protein [Candidatus Chloroploca sp. Khr17]